MWWEELIKFAPALAAFAAVFGGFSKLESLVSPEAKASISAWLQGLDTRKVGQNWASQFITLFDTAFGSKHFSWKCFLRSCIASILLSFLVFFVFITPHDLSFPEPQAPVGVLIVGSVLLLSVSLLPDYFSLLKTRYILQIMCRNDGLALHAVLAVVDVISVFFIWTFFTSMWSLTIDVVYHATGGHTLLPRLLLQSVGNDRRLGEYVVISCFLAGYFTSLWASLFFISGLLSRLISRSHSTIKRMVWFFDVKTKPLQSIGYVAGIISAVVTYVVTVAL